MAGKALYSDWNTSMRYWWVNQNQTFKSEVSGDFLWSPKRRADGARNQFYENMREVAPGDLVFSFYHRTIAAVGIAGSNCYSATKPDEFGLTGKNWDATGWKVNVAFREMPNPIVPKDHIDLIRPLLPSRYSPLQSNGDGLQAVYLAEISKEFADVLLDLLGAASNPAVSSETSWVPDRSVVETTADENQLEEGIRTSDEIPETEKEQLVMARRGQGSFRHAVQCHETHCRITRVDDPRFLIASHIKPWRACTNSERLDGENGLLLAPNVDLVFDRGFISFDDSGTLLISPVGNPTALQQLGIPTAEQFNAGSFTEGQKHYLAFHRREVFLKAVSIV